MRTSCLALALAASVWAAPAMAQPTAATSDAALGTAQPEAPRRAYDATDLALAGELTLLGAWALSGLATKIAQIVMIATGFHGDVAWPECDVCDYGGLYGVSWIPIAGPAIWGSLFLDAGNGVGILGLVLSAGQLVGVAMLIAAAILHHDPRPPSREMIRATPLEWRF